MKLEIHNYSFSGLKKIFVRNGEDFFLCFCWIFKICLYLWEILITKIKIMTRVIALKDGVSQGNSIVTESIKKLQKMFILKYGGRLDSYGNIVCNMKGCKWEFQLKSINS